MDYLKYEEKENEFVQYKVSVDIEKLRNVEYEIIEHCSFIKHIEGEFRGSQIPNQYTLMDLIRYRNLQTKLIRKEPDFDLEYNRPNYYDIYRLSYDEYIFPLIVEKIEEVLKACSDTNEINGTLAEAILEYEEETKISNPILEIKERIKMLQENSSQDTSQFARNLNEIKKITEFYELNKQQQPVTDYLKKVKDCFLLEPKFSIHIVDLINSYPFLDQEVKKKLDKVLASSTLQYLNPENIKAETPNNLTKRRMGSII